MHCRVLQVVMAVLAAHGYSQAASAAEADVVLLNTCSIREKAEAKIFSRLGVLRKLNRDRDALSPAGEAGTRRGKVQSLLVIYKEGVCARPVPRSQCSHA